MNSKKVGRNTPCPCGNGKKFKRCHGSPHFQEQLTQAAQYQRERVKAEALQRERQQGRGRPIVSTEHNGTRFVAVKNRLFHSKSWRTFHDFLGDYIKMVLGPAWGTSEIAKPLEERHPILVWYHHLCIVQQQYIKTPGQVTSMPKTGAISAYTQLAYDLYALDHNAELQKKLIGRLKNADNFAGARYEVFVAAVMIRAGFDLEFSNEDDRNKTHCEFIATHKRTSRKFSVEAKHRTGTRFRLGRQLIRALGKDADHARIIFIDINIPDDTTEVEFPAQMEAGLRNVRSFEDKIINGNSLPDAYLFITNTPWHLHLERQAIKCAVMFDGFQIPEFKVDFHFTSVRAAVDAREKHIEMHDLFRSIGEHLEIPSTFDGEIPEFAYGDATTRLLIGERYAVTGDDGIERAGLLTSAMVWEAEKKAMCTLQVEGGASGIYSWPLSDAELSAWRKHPETFFGQVERSKRATTALELYDSIYATYRSTSKEKLLEFLATSPDTAMLADLDQPMLARLYAERCTTGLLASGFKVGKSAA
jgi:hypothetical protein